MSHPRFQASEGLAQPASGPITTHGIADLASGHETRAPDQRVVEQDEQDEMAPVQRPSGVIDAAVLRAEAQAISRTQAHPLAGTRTTRPNHARSGFRDYALRRFLPLARRRLRTLRPPSELIRERKPCVFFRRRLCG